MGFPATPKPLPAPRVGPTPKSYMKSSSLIKNFDPDDSITPLKVSFDSEREWICIYTYIYGYIYEWIYIVIYLHIYV